jgi:beta-glucanase (GH16 family)
MKYRVAATIFALAASACSGAQTSAPLAPASVPANAVRHHQASAKLLFADEFDGSSIDRTVWYTCFFWQKHPKACSDAGLARFEEHNVGEHGGFATIVAESHAPTPAHPFTSGMMQTGATPSTPASFAYLYGYAETRAKFPRGTGMWPAFWLVPKSGAWPPEIDIFEWQGIEPRVDVMTIHYTGPNGKPAQNVSAVDTGTDLWSAYHTYGVDWEPNAVTWYFDGKPVKRYTDARFVPNKPMYVVFSLNIGGWEPGSNHPKASEFPATFSIDYVRVWSSKP